MAMEQCNTDSRLINLMRAGLYRVRLPSCSSPAGLVRMVAHARVLPALRRDATRSQGGSHSTSPGAHRNGHKLQVCHHCTSDMAEWAEIRQHMAACPSGSW